VAAAAAALALPAPASVADRWHDAVYLRLQPVVTGFSSRVTFAWVDVLIAAAVSAAIWVWTRPLARAARGRRGRAMAAAAWQTATLGACAYLVFLALWGLNYSRSPLASRLAFEPSRVEASTVRDLASAAVAGLNELHAEVHARSWPATTELPAVLGASFAETQRLLGAPRLAIPAAPKHTLLGPYFRRASIAGLTNPYLLEVMITPDALPFERPSILAHEWAHLAGYANESEAEFAGWVTCMLGDPQARYSAWLSLFPRFPGAVRAEAARQLAAGPRQDFAAIRERLQRASPTVTRVAWSGYDRFLRAHRVAEGAASYDLVVRLVAGTEFDEAWRPRLRECAGVAPTRPCR
jgi:hypothetical protein